MKYSKKRKFSGKKFKPYKKRYGKKKGSYTKLKRMVRNLARTDLEKHRTYNYTSAANIDVAPGPSYFKAVFSNAVTASYPLTRDEGGSISNGKTRTGSKIYIRRIDWNGTILLPGSASSGVVRFLIWRQLVPGQFYGSDLLDATNSGYLQVYAPYNRNNAGTKFEILYDKLY